jgi:DNA-binding NarL/FixJ family response regulator
MTQTRIGLVEDHPLVLGALLQTLEQAAMLHVVGTAKNGAELLAGWQHWGADLIVVDIELPDRNGIEVAAEVLETDPAAGIVFYSGSTETADVRAALEVGARGFLSKAAPPEQLVPALLDAAGGKQVFDSETAALAVAAMRDAGQDDAGLTLREKQVLEHIACGASDARIAKAIGVSPNTIKTHVKNAMAKLGVNTRAAGVGQAVSRGIIGPPPPPEDA